MKKLINKFLNYFNAEIHGKGYLQALSKGEFSHDQYDFQKKIIKNHDKLIIFDLGANRGDTVEKYLELFPKAEIHAFEPFPLSFEILSKRYQNDKRVILNNIAVSDHNNKSTLYVNKNVDTNSLLKPQKTGLSSDKQVANVDTIEINNTTLTKYCENKKIETIDILKMDIQGGELNVLKGGKELLSKNKIDLIYSEAYFIEQYENQPLFFEIATHLLSNNYLLQDIYSPIYGNQALAWCDVIFIKKTYNI